MAQTTHSAYIAARSFVDFDELAAESRQWNLDLRQLDRGIFRGELLQFGIEDIHISDARFGRTLDQKGAPPPGLRTVGVPATKTQRFVWRGTQITGNDLLVFPRGAELSSVSNPEFHVFTCSFPEELLAAIAESLCVPELGDVGGSSEAVRCMPSAMVALRKCLRRLSRAARRDAHVLSDPEFAVGLRCQLPRRIVSAISGSTSKSSRATSGKRELVLNRAAAFIENNAAENPMVRDLCDAVQASQRTLEYAFVERFGITPKAFLMAHRLNAVRKELRSTRSEARVTDIANDWGFWHMGQFAADYRKQFGELPSQTLRRVRAG